MVDNILIYGFFSIFVQRQFYDVARLDNGNLHTVFTEFMNHIVELFSGYIKLPTCLCDRNFTVMFFYVLSCFSVNLPLDRFSDDTDIHAFFSQ